MVADFRVNAATSTAGDARIRVLVIGVPGPITKRTQTAVRHAGMAIDTADFAGQMSPDVWRPELDVVVLIPGPSEGDILPLLKEWRVAGLRTPVLTVTECNPTGCLDAGADDCVPPTLDPKELVARLRALARRREHRDPVLRLHDLVIDTTTRTVTRGGRVVRLTAREYSLLKFLAFLRGKPATREAILDQVFDGDPSGTSNVVAVYIRTLRKKIDTGFDPALVVTHWGWGYSLLWEGPESATSQSAVTIVESPKAALSALGPAGAGMRLTPPG